MLGFSFLVFDSELGSKLFVVYAFAGTAWGSPGSGCVQHKPLLYKEGQRPEFSIDGDFFEKLFEAKRCRSFWSGISASGFGRPCGTYHGGTGSPHAETWGYFRVSPLGQLSDTREAYQIWAMDASRAKTGCVNV